MSSLRHVSLAFNQLQFIGSCSFTAFNYLSILDLQTNQIETLKEYTFHGLNSLVLLDLKKNRIMQYNAFFGLTSLPALDLSNQCLTGLVSESFNGMPGLNQLIMSSNQIRLLLNNTFLQLEKLEKLYQIESIIINAFNGLKNLSHLDLSRNKLKNILFENKSIFYQLNSLEHLCLENNSVNELNRSYFKGLYLN